MQLVPGRDGGIRGGQVCEVWQLLPSSDGGRKPSALASVESEVNEAAIAAAKINLVFMLYSFVIGMAIIRLHEYGFAPNAYLACFVTQDFGFYCFSFCGPQISINKREWDELPDFLLLSTAALCAGYLRV